MFRIRRSRAPPLIAAVFLCFVVWQFVFQADGPLPFGLPSSPSSRTSVRFVKSSYDWNGANQRNPLTIPFTQPPIGPPAPIPRVQFDFASRPADPDRDAEMARRRDSVRLVFERGWQGYRRYAWARDELMPVKGSGKDTFGGWAASLVDSLDTLWIMGLRKEFYEAARTAAAIDWSSTSSHSIQVFETTIRHLGGLIAAFELSGESAILEKARELADMLYIAFDTPNRIPNFWLNFRNARAGTQRAGLQDASSAIGSLSLEFSRLSQITGDPKYYDATDRITEFFRRTQNQTRLPGMWPVVIDFRSGAVFGSSFTLGGRSDSLYEYLPKMYMLLGGRDDRYRNMTETALDTVKKHLLFRPRHPDTAARSVLLSGRLMVAGATAEKRLVAEAEHLSCFAGGMYALAGKVLGRDDYLSIGEQLALGCSWLYSVFPKGIMPESLLLTACAAQQTEGGPAGDHVAECKWEEGATYTYEDTGISEDAGAVLPEALPVGVRSIKDQRYLLRPEAIESLFYAYRITGREEYREKAWVMFQAIEAATATKYGNSAIRDVTEADNTTLLDSMESFWFSETLKYFYLIFSPPDLLSLDKFVLNTEAHPFRYSRGYSRLTRNEDSQNSI